MLRQTETPCSRNYFRKCDGRRRNRPKIQHTKEDDLKDATSCPAGLTALVQKKFWPCPRERHLSWIISNVMAPSEYSSRCPPSPRTASRSNPSAHTVRKMTADRPRHRTLGRAARPPLNTEANQKRIPQASWSSTGPKPIRDPVEADPSPFWCPPPRACGRRPENRRRPS